MQMTIILDDSDVITPVVEIFDEENQEFWKKSSKGCESVIGPSQENGGGWITSTLWIILMPFYHLSSTLLL